MRIPAANKSKLIFLLILIIPLIASAAFAQRTPTEPLIADSIPVEEYYRGKVVEIYDSRTEDAGGFEQFSQSVRVRFESGDLKGEERDLEYGGFYAQTTEQRLREGDRVVIVKTPGADSDLFYIVDQNRLPPLAVIAVIFLILVVLLGRLRGFTAILGMVLSVLALVFFIVPQIVSGHNPLLVSVIGAAVVAFLSLYLAHGFNRKTTVALAGTLITLGAAAGLAVAFVSATKLFGFGSEAAYYVRILGSTVIDLRGLLMGGIIIGALGVLDDITVGQAATVAELKEANPELGRAELYRRGIRVGREHIASLVNTLVLAYAGAAFPLLLLFTMNEQIPIWVTLNSELIAEEIVRTLVGSTALILAVPVTTVLAAHFFSKKAKQKYE